MNDAHSEDPDDDDHSNTNADDTLHYDTVSKCKYILDYQNLRLAMVDQQTSSASECESTLLAQTNDIEGEERFPQGCAFSPDGLCVLTATGPTLRLYNTIFPSQEKDESSIRNKVKDLKTALACQGGYSNRSYAWYPHMKSSEPSSCCFVATSRDQPVHLYDAYSGKVRAFYRPYNALDEVEAPTVASFTPDGQSIVAAGFRTDRTIHVFSVSRPGRDSTIWRLGKTRRSKDGQKGLVSALAHHSDNLLAVGTYAPGSIYLYDHRTQQLPTGSILNGLCVVGHGKSHSRKKRRFASLLDEDDEDDEEDVENWLSAAKIKWFMQRAQGGVTQLKFSPDRPYILYSASRRSNAILTWDLRMLSDNPDYQSNPICGIGSFAVASDTNQRIEFDVGTDQTLYVGGVDKTVRMYDTASGKQKGIIGGFDDVCNGVSCSSVNSSSMLAVAVGARQFPSEDNFDKDNIETSETESPGCLHMYSLKSASTKTARDSS